MLYQCIYLTYVTNVSKTDKKTFEKVLNRSKCHKNAAFFCWHNT